jgi:erythromycin esterase
MNKTTFYYPPLFINQNIIRGLLLFTGLLFLSISVFPQDITNEKYKKDFVSWLTNNAHTIKTVDAGNGFEDLQPFKNILKDVQVVGLGEATHGTSEFFRMKHRMLEFLVKEMGYTNFLLETSMANCRYVNQYVLYGKGDVDTATAIPGDIPWRVEEVRSMIKWMRQYNSTVSEDKKVKFLGFDFQGSYLLWKDIRSYYKKVNPSYSPNVDTISKQMLSIIRYHYKGDSISAQKVKALFETKYPDYAKIEADMLTNAKQYENAAGYEEYEKNLQNIRLVAEELEMLKSGGRPSVRDQYMAENVLDMVKKAKSGEKFVLWAHNFHIIKFTSANYTTMGYHIWKALDNKYYGVEFEFYSGAFQTKNLDIPHDPKSWLDWDVMSVGAPSEGSLPWYLNKTGKESLFIDFRHTSSKNIKLFQTEFDMHDLEGAYSAKKPSMDGVHLYWFDGLIYIKTSTAAKNFKFYLQ